MRLMFDEAENMHNMLQKNQLTKCMNNRHHEIPNDTAEIIKIIRDKCQRVVEPI